MSFVATGNSSAPAGEPIQNIAFWPDIDPSEFRLAQRVDTSVTAERVHDALLAAIVDANTQLREWQSEQEADGLSAVDEVPEPAWRPPGALPALYCRAVYALAKANLMERYRDYDTTAAGGERAERLELTVDDYRRDAAWAIADITERRRTTVELI